MKGLFSSKLGKFLCPLQEKNEEDAEESESKTCNSLLLKTHILVLKVYFLWDHILISKNKKLLSNSEQISGPGIENKQEF